MRDWIYRFARRFGPKREPGSKLLRNNSAIDISFGTVGFARVLARPFVRVRYSISCVICLQDNVLCTMPMKNMNYLLRSSQKMLVFFFLH